MAFDSPMSLFWLSLGVPVVLLYILKIRLRRVPVSTVLFWKQVVDEQNPRSIWQRLRHLLSLLLQLLLLALLAFAVADPYFAWEIRAARRIVLVIDHSASMNATDVTPSRLAEARRQAAQIVAGLRHRDEVALVSAGTEPQVVVGFTSRQSTLRSALQALSATDGTSNVAAAVTLARRLQGERTDGKTPQIIVLSDGCFEGAGDLGSTTGTTAAPESVKLDLRLIGERTANAGITQFQVRRSLVDPLGYEILAEVTNAADQPLECRFEVDLDGETIDVVPLKIVPGGRWSQVFEKTSAAGGTVTARLTHDDALAADNVAHAILPRREIQPVLLVTSGNLFLQKVFEVNPLVKLTVVSDPPETVPAGTVVVYHRISPDRVPPGPVFLIDPANSTDLFQVGEPIANPIVTRQDRDHPLMAHVRLDNVLMPESRTLIPADREQTQVLAEVVTKEPVFFAVNRPNGRVLVLTVNLDKGDLPLRTAFPIAVANALHWFSGSKGDLREALSTGVLTTVSSRDFARDPGSTPLVLRSPLGTTSPLPRLRERITIGPLDQCGLWSVLPAIPETDSSETSPVPLLEFACNLASSRESEIRPPEELVAARSLAPPRIAGLGSRPLWFWLLLAGLLLTTVEWGLYHRRVIR